METKNSVNINALAAEAHANAVRHGFWAVPDVEERLIALLHCELSEAIQAEREEQPMFYSICERWDGTTDKCTLLTLNVCAEYPVDALTDNGKHCSYRKPDGIAVELADFVIRLLDYAAGNRIGIPRNRLILETYSSLPALVNHLHFQINEVERHSKPLQGCIIADSINTVRAYLHEQGIDLWSVVREKMDYNKTRPALHGKKY